MTSPVSGKYSVVLDNVTTTLSAQSSLTQQNTLLYFATGLDIATLHNVQVINEGGGDLSLNSDGFQVYSVKPPRFVFTFFPYCYSKRLIWVFKPLDNSIVRRKYGNRQ